MTLVEGENYKIRLHVGMCQRVVPNQNDSCVACGYYIVDVMAQDILSHLYGYN